MKTILTALALLLPLPALAFSSEAVPTQPKDERQAQNALPISHDAMWGTLLKARITYADKAPFISAKIPPEIKALNGTTVTLSGFVLPMDSEGKTRHFLLSKRTPTCPYCPPGEPNEVVEVYSRTTVPWDESLLTMRGTFTLINNTDNGIFFVLKNADKVSAPGTHNGEPRGKEALW